MSLIVVYALWAERNEQFTLRADPTSVYPDLCSSTMALRHLIFLLLCGFSIVRHASLFIFADPTHPTCLSVKFKACASSAFLLRKKIFKKYFAKMWKLWTTTWWWCSGCSGTPSPAPTSGGRSRQPGTCPLFAFALENKIISCGKSVYELEAIVETVRTNELDRRSCWNTIC